jgi:hypothetical protein
VDSRLVPVMLRFSRTSQIVISVVHRKQLHHHECVRMSDPQ